MREEGKNKEKRRERIKKRGEIKAEILKYLMHCRELTPAQIISYATLYLKGVNKSNVFILQL